MPLKVPASLVRHLNDGRCVLFVGAGLSAQAKLPSWGKLLGDLVQQVGADDPDEDGTAELQRLLAAGRFLDVADECKERLGAGYAEFLATALQVGAGPVPEAHQLVMRLPFAAWITTNYDKLLEQAHFQVRGAVPKTLTHLDADTFGTLLFDGAPFILKAHGDIDKPESLIFTTRDYREIIHSNPAFQAVFSAILLTRAVLFVGYSLNDPDFRLLLDRQLTTFKKFVPERYAIMSGVGEVEREVLRRTAQIKVISYPANEHGQLVEFLRALQGQIAGSPKEKGGPLAGDLAGPAVEAGATLEAVEVRAAPQPREPLKSSVPGLGMALSATPPLVQPPPPASASLPSRSAAPEDELQRAWRPGARPASSPATDRRWKREEDDERQAGAGEPADAAPASQTAQPLVLDLKLNGSRIQAVLFGNSGPLEFGSAPFSNAPLMRHLANAKTAADYQRVGLELVQMLPGGVRNALEQTVTSGTPLVLELDAELESRPWELLEVRGQPLALQAAISRAPVGLSPTARGRPTMRRPPKALLVGDPTGNLPGARVEVEHLAKLYGDGVPVVFIGEHATAENISPHTLAETDIIHFAGHAWYDAQDVYLTLAGGVHLTDDLIRPGLSHHPPGVVMLNSHYTAFVPPGVGSKGPDPMKATSAGRMGFTDVLMQAGVGVFVGCFGSPSDSGATAVALAFHQALLAGVPAAEALRRARNDPSIPKDDPTPLLYTLSGYGDMTLG